MWDLEIATGSEETTSIRATHIVMSIGAGCQIPTMPTYPGLVSIFNLAARSDN